MKKGAVSAPSQFVLGPFPARAMALVLVLAALLYGALITRFRTGVFNDDAVYVLVSNDLTNERASRLLPTLRPDYPLPGLPLFLSPFAKLLGPDWVQMEWLSVIVTLVTLWLLARWLIRWFPPWHVLSLVALYAFNPTVVKFSGVVMPAPYYSLAIVVSFFLMTRVLRHPSTLSCLGLGFILGWSSVVRPEGVVLLLGVWGGLVWGGVKKRVHALILIPVLLWVGVVVFWMRFRHLTQSDYAGDLQALFTFWSTHLLTGLQFFMTFLHLLLVRTLLAADLVPTFQSGVIGGGVVIGLVVVMFVGFRFLWRHQLEMRAELVGLLLFTGLYLAVHTFWHVALARYCVALLPFVLLFLLSGLSVICPSVQKNGRVLAILLAPVFLSYGYSHWIALREVYTVQDPLKRPPWRTLSWLRKNTPDIARVMSPISSSLALYSNRPAVSVIKSENAESFVYGLQHEGIEYIADRHMQFVTPGVGNTEDLNNDWRKVRRWVTLYPQWFYVVFHDEHESTSVYRVKEDPLLREGYDFYFSAARELRKNRTDAAMALVEKSLERCPDLGVAKNLQGVICFSRADYGNAERAFKSAARRLPDNPVPIMNLASLYHRNGQMSQAIETLNNGLLLVSANGTARKRFPKLQMLMKSWEQKKEVMLF